MRKSIYTLLISFYFINSLAQQSNTDSLVNLLASQIEDTAKVNVLNALAYEFRNTNPDSTLSYAKQALNLSASLNYKTGMADAYLWIACGYFASGNQQESLENSRHALEIYNAVFKTFHSSDTIKILKQMARSYHTRGNAFLRSDKYEEALKNYSEALQIRTAIGDNKGMADSKMNIGLVYDNIGNYTEALNNFGFAIKIAERLKDKKTMAIAHTNIGNIHDSKGNFAEALDHYFIAIKLYQDLSEKNGIANAYHNIANIYLRQGNYPESLKNYMASIKLKEETGDRFGMAQTYNNIASLYIQQKNYAEALKSCMTSLKIRQELHDKRGISDSWSVLGTINERLSHFDEAIKNNTEALEIRQEIGDKKGMAGSYFNIGSLYESMGNYTLSLENLHLSLTIRREIQDKKGLAECYLGMGKILTLVKKFSEASDCLKEALALSGDIKSLEELRESYLRLSELENAQGNIKKAFDYYKLYIGFRDSLYNEENTKKLVQVGMQYEFDKKEAAANALNDKQNTIAQAEIKRQSLIKNSAMAGIAVILFAGLISFAFYKRKRDAELQKNESDFKAEVSEIEMKALRSQMNPHFIFNSLNSISDYMSRNDIKTADNYLTKFAKVMRLILENSEHKEVPLNEDLKALELYMQLESLRMKKKFDYEIRVDPAIDPENTLIPPLILQPFVENSIWHGLSNKVGDGKIIIHIHKNGEMLQCTVEDNGIGREKSQATKEGIQFAEKKSLGMKITKARIDILNKLKKSKAGVELIDLSEGMKVVVNLPLELSF